MKVADEEMKGSSKDQKITYGGIWNRKAMFRICVIDDHAVTLEMLRTILINNTKYQVEVFSDPRLALECCHKNTFDIIIVDYSMPSLNGVEFIRLLRQISKCKHVPVIMLTADCEHTLRLTAIEAGATCFLNKPFDPQELRIIVRNLCDIHKANLEAEDNAFHLLAEVESVHKKFTEQEEELIFRLARMVEARDTELGNHDMRVAQCSQLIARQIGLDEKICRVIFLAAPLHDIGKIGIPDAILHKHGKLSSDEIIIMRKHTTIGATLLGSFQSDLLKTAYDIAVSHHEKWDGTGYGQGLGGEAIPLSGRIVAIADVFDALVSERPYKPAWSLADARKEIIAQSGRHFDPSCVAAFEACWPEIVSVYQL